MPQCIPFSVARAHTAKNSMPTFQLFGALAARTRGIIGSHIKYTFLDDSAAHAGDLRSIVTKNDNFTKGNHRAQGTPDISPRGEPGPPPGVLTPQSPCTIERAVGVGTLYQDTIYASAATTNVTTPFCTGRGGSSIPSGRRRILVQGHPRPPPSHARAAILLQCQIKGNH